MAKLSSFFRRLFASLTAETDCSTPAAPESRRNVTIVPPILPEASSSHRHARVSRSCSSSPRPQYRVMRKQTTIHIDHCHDGNFNPNALPSDAGKATSRRLSAPLIIHASTHHHRRKHRATLVTEHPEEASSVPSHRQSLSSTTTTGTSAHHNNSVNSLGTSGGSPCASPRYDARSSSLNLSPSTSINLPSPLNNISPASGTPPSQFAAGPSSTSPRVSIHSNNSPSPSAGRRMSLQMRGRRPSMFDPIDPKELQQALYASAKGSLPSGAPNDEDASRPLSRLSISYDRASAHVCVDTLSLENLHLLDGYASNNSGDSISFYCRFRLLPEKRSLFQTKVARCTRLQSSYLFDKKQLSEFELAHEQLNHHAIEIFVYKISSVKPLYRDVRLATIKYDLNELSQSDQSRMKKTFEDCDPASITQDPDLGELLLSLSYLQSAAKLSVVIIEAKNLRPLSTESKGLPDACVKVTLYDRNGKKLKRKKTSVQRTSDCPTFNEEFVFELRRDVAAEVTIEVRLVHESLSYKEHLGSVLFGPMKGTLSPENVYWSTVLSGESLNAQWHVLKPPVKIEETK